MSFSSDVKEEILRLNIKRESGGFAWLVAIIRNSANVDINKHKINIVVQTKNALIARKIFEALKILYGYMPPIIMKKVQASTVYTIRMNDDSVVLDLLKRAGIERSKGAIKYQKIYLLDNVKREYIRGLFLVNGSINCPQKNYHLEIINDNIMLAIENEKILKDLGLDFKIVERKDQYVLYVKNGEGVVDFLNVVKAHKALMEFENIRVVKELKNNVNRMINCETANLEKVVNTSVRQVMCIEYIEKTIGIDKLPYRLREIARLRLQNRELSLKDLGQMLTPALGKSGVNHRLKKIEEIASKLATKTNENLT
ncbi:MAG: DNA-binding protein WhiA [Clostridiales bacterium]|nr:DNA-binding protein WhiA [Clostridiales bacterium]